MTQGGGLKARERAVLEGHRRVLELMAAGAPLLTVLNCLCEVIEAAVPQAKCSVLLLDTEGKRVRHAAGPSLPREYTGAIDNEPIGPCAGSCGTAAFLGKPVVVEDVSRDPLWKNYSQTALKSGLFACASLPIMGREGDPVLGTFAIYHSDPGPFEDEELELLRDMKDLAFIAIVSEKRQRAIERLQREESVSLVASGVAHDFNNLLTIITGNLELIESELSENSGVASHVADASEAVLRARDLTHQLLTLSGKSSLLPGPISLNEVVSSMTRLLSVSIPKNINLNLVLDAELPPISADLGKLHQVVLNLVTNAAESIGSERGEILITTRQVTIEPGRIRGGFSRILERGKYLVLEVADSGPGLSSGIDARIFEPFFTTKESGKGLGLSVVSGVMRAHQGGIEVATRLGGGARFVLYFPIQEGGA